MFKRRSPGYEIVAIDLDGNVLVCHRGRPGEDHRIFHYRLREAVVEQLFDNGGNPICLVKGGEACRARTRLLVLRDESVHHVFVGGLDKH